MKKIILTLFVCTMACLGHAQINTAPDSSAKLKPHTYGTDSVKSGNKVFHGGKGEQPDKKSKKQPQHDNKSGMRQEQGTPQSSTVAPSSGRPKY